MAQTKEYRFTSLLLFCAVGLMLPMKQAIAQPEPAERWFATGVIAGSSRSLGPFASLPDCERGQKAEGDRMASASRDSQRKAEAMESERFAFVRAGETGNAHRVQAGQRSYFETARKFERLSSLWANGAICSNTKTH